MGKKIFVYIIVFIVLISCFVIYSIYNTYEIKMNTSTEELYNYELENKELYSKVKQLNLTLSELKLENKQLYEDVNLMDGKIKRLENVAMTVIYDTIYLESEIEQTISNDTLSYKINWSFNNTDLHLNGNTTLGLLHMDNRILFHKSCLDSLRIKIDLVCGLTYSNNEYYYNIISKNPNVFINNIESFNLDKINKHKCKKYSLSIFTGPSIDVYNKSYGWCIGFGLSYDLLNLF